MAKKTYRVLETSWINNSLQQPGAVVSMEVADDFKHGENLEPYDEDGKPLKAAKQKKDE